MNNTNLRVALYARVSTEAQEEEGQSLSTQIEMMRDVVRRLGAEVADEYQVQESAMPGRERPSLTRLLRDAAAGRFDAVMVCKMDRLSRCVEVLTHVENNLRTFGIQLFEGKDEHNLRSAEGRLNRGMQALIGEYSVNRLKWSACASRLERAKRGWPHSGLLPFGRQVSNSQDRRISHAEWSLIPAKAALAAEMYRLYISSVLDFSGALTRVVDVYDSKTEHGVGRAFSIDEMAELSSLAVSIEGAIRFRSSPQASKQSSWRAPPEASLPPCH